MDTNAIEIIENPQHNEQSDSDIDHEPTLANANSTRKRALSVNSKEIARAVLNNLSCKHIGWIGFMRCLQCSWSVRASSLSFLFTQNNTNSSNFQKIGRPMVWMFLLFSILYFLRFMHIAITWKDTLKESIEAKYVLGASETTTEVTFVSRMKARYKKMTAYYEDNFDINGKYYLWILYIGELMEDWVQFTNILQVYSCMLPVGWNLVFICILIFESLNRCKVFYRKVCSEIPPILTSTNATSN